ncbi:hypothetical protein SAMN05444521_1869 [Streptomyces sp. 3214.6]|nr:hypothetical protein [Streptomyces sp. 3214.6]SHH77930.1 hypothetical protein SAMN05444521_1869 [Streptomyces sp. 3214.6]
MAVDPLIELRDVNKYFGELHVPPFGIGEVDTVPRVNISLGQVPPRPFRRWGSVAVARAKDFLSKILKH